MAVRPPEGRDIGGCLHGGVELSGDVEFVGQALDRVSADSSAQFGHDTQDEISVFDHRGRLTRRRDVLRRGGGQRVARR